MVIDAVINPCNFGLGMVFSSCCDMSKYFWLPCEIREVTAACLGSKYAFEKQQHTEVSLMSGRYVRGTSWHSYNISHRFHELERWVWD